MIRGDRPRFSAVRADARDKGSVLGMEIKGSEANATVRDVGASLGHLPRKIDEDNIHGVVVDLIEVIDGPVARAIMEIGRYIDDRGKYNGP
jgi:hypothetical protein